MKVDSLKWFEIVENELYFRKGLRYLVLPLTKIYPVYVSWRLQAQPRRLSLLDCFSASLESPWK